MGTFKDVYDILKDLLSFATTIETKQLVMNLQEKFFELREENENLKEEIKTLKDNIKILENIGNIEEDLEYSVRGFVLLKTDKKKIPYCSCCWKKEHKLIPLSQYGNYFQYECGNCRTKVIVLDDSGNEIL
ncbi:MAG: hypothetical protein J6C23_09150 [Clostridia bacterium]|nr:hypothetical protein [Clostridia bacterium]